jgi:signal transduction histidine kinase
MAVGLSWFIGTFGAAAGEDVSLAGFAFGGASTVVLMWLLLAYPSGRIGAGRDRALLLAAVVVYLAEVSNRLFLYVPPDGTGCGCAPNRFLPITDPRMYEAIDSVHPWVDSVVFALVVAAAIHRWRRSSAPGRRMLAPVVACGVLAAAELAYDYVIRQQTDQVVPTAHQLFFVLAAVRVLTAVAFVVGLGQLRRTRSAVVDLVGALPDQGSAGRLVDALRLALGDPSLELVPWSDAAGAYLRADGRRQGPEVREPGRATTVISEADRPVALLVHDQALLADPGLVSAVAAAVRLTTDNERLRGELERQLAEVAASRARIISAGDAERSRIERDLHDGAQQRLVTIALALRLAEARLPAGTDPATGQAIAQAVKDLGEAIDELRDLARGIHPAVLSESGLAAALESLVDRSPSPVELRLEPFPEPSLPVATAAYYVVAECLTNVTKHARATSVTVEVRPDRGGLLAVVSDDGGGGAAPTPGRGLAGLADRVAALDGRLTISDDRDVGTQVRAWLPYA